MDSQLKQENKRIKKKFFVFVDESGNNDQENLFLIGCLFVPVEKIGEYHELLNKVKSKIITKVKQKELELVKKLEQSDLINFYKGRRTSYEIKFKHINATVSEEYRWLISQYFKFPDVRYCCLVIDKSKYPNPSHMSFYEIYINQLVMLLKNNIKENEEIVLLPDDITISGDGNYESLVNNKLIEKGKNIFGTHRLDSHSNIFIQMTDVLTGAVLYDMRKLSHAEKQKVVDKVREKTELENLGQNITARQCPNYFSVWIYQGRK